MINLVRNSKESSDKLVNRFIKKVQASRIIILAKAGRYFQKPLKKRKIRSAAVMRDHYRELKETRKYL